MIMIIEFTASRGSSMLEQCNMRLRCGTVYSVIMLFRKIDSGKYLKKLLLEFRKQLFTME